MIFLTYLAKTVLCSAILFGYYWLFLRNRRFHHYNRFYLLLTLLLSVTLPLLNLRVLLRPENRLHEAVRQVTRAVELPTWVPMAASTPTLNATDAPTPLFTLSNGLWLLYALGAAYGLFLFIGALYHIYRLTRKYPVQKMVGMRFYDTNEPDTPFSFFRLLFWNERIAPDSEAGHQILKHELFHIQQKHSADMLLTELVCMLGWFNPVFHLLRRELKTIHEFLADQHAVSGHDRFAYATLLVQQAAQQKQLALPHYFAYQPIKRRIAMITNNKQNVYSYWSRLLALPMLIILTCVITLKAQEVKPSRQVVNAEPAKATEVPITAKTAAAAQAAVPAKAPVPVPASSSSPLTHSQWTRVDVEETPIDIEKVRTLTRGTSMKKVEELLGEPMQKALSNDAGAWLYRDGEIQLSIRFDRLQDKIEDFSYANPLYKAPTENIDYDAVRLIKEQATSADNIRATFGKPMSIYIAPERERWEYRTENKQLIIDFDLKPSKEPVVHNFQYIESNQ